MNRQNIGTITGIEKEQGMFEQGMFDLDGLIAEAASESVQAVERSIRSEMAIFEAEPVEGAMTPWGKALRVVKVIAGVKWVDGTDRSGYWLAEGLGFELDSVFTDFDVETQHGWYREGISAGAVIARWPDATVGTLARIDCLEFTQAAEMLRRQALEAMRWLGEQLGDSQVVKQRMDVFNSQTITDIEEVPDENYDAESAVGAGVGEPRAVDEPVGEPAQTGTILAGEPAQVGTAGTGGGERSGLDGSEGVDHVSGEGEGLFAGEVLGSVGSTVGGETAGRDAGGDDSEGSGSGGFEDTDQVRGAGFGVGVESSFVDGGGRGADEAGGDFSGGLGEDLEGRGELSGAGRDVGEGFTTEVMRASGPALMTRRLKGSGSDFKNRVTLSGVGDPKQRFEANVRAISLVRQLEVEERSPSEREQRELALWTGWGGLSGVFARWSQEDEGPFGGGNWQHKAAVELRELLSNDEWEAAAASTVNAYFTPPQIAGAMWDVLGEYGIGEGSVVLEPGCGAGRFLAAAADNVRTIGVEVDPLTAQIAHYLAPNQQIRHEGFEKTIVKPGMVDAVIGNVPFGEYQLHDPMHNGARLPIHNHFIVKSLAATRPGGLVAVITSAYTMDAKSSRGRVEMAKLGNLVGALRLPSSAFTSTGTNVVTDVLVFQRLEEDRPVPNVEKLPWLRTREFRDGVFVNEVFLDHPDRVLGTLSTVSGRFGPTREVMRSTALDASEVRDGLRAQLAQGGVRVPAREGGAVLNDLELTSGLFERIDTEHVPVVGSVFDSKKLPESDPSLGRLIRWTGTSFEQAGVPKKAQAETLALVHVRDAMQRVLRTQSGANYTHQDRVEAREELNRVYDKYTRAYGPINRFEMHTRTASPKQIDAFVARAEKAWVKQVGAGLSKDERADLEATDVQRGQWREEAIEELTQSVKRQEHLRYLRSDPTLGQLLGCEVFDDSTQVAQKSAIFSSDVVGRTVRRESAESIEEAVAISMDEYRRVNVDRVAELMGWSVQAVEEAIIGAAFIDPVSGEYEPASRYLAGQVRTKLEAAREAAVTDERFKVNVDALEAVQPEWITVDEIDLVPGINVLTAEDYRVFAREVFRVDVQFSHGVEGGVWEVSGPERRAFREDTLARFATANRNPAQLLQSVMNQRPVIIRTTNPDTERTEVDQKETALAGECCRALIAEFGRWVVSNSEVRERVEREWNMRYNQTVAPRYDALGKALALPGLSSDITPHPYQREAVARILNEPATLLNHVVGAGKTGTMVMAAMELRRTGQASKPWLVVPNHLVEQVTREATQWYPQAQVMGIPTGLSPAERQTWMARSAGQDWDLVVCPQSVFKLMSVDKNREVEYIRVQVDALHNALSDEKQKNPRGHSVRQIQVAINRLETRMERLFESKDAGMTFEQTGCDYLMVDEAHHYKNLARASDMQDLAHNGSQMASDLDMKLEVLREFRIDMAKRSGTWYEGMVPHVAVFATGTPVANSLSELWVMQKYLRPDLLRQQGTFDLREWGRAFARSTVANEPTAGGTWKPKDRVRKFANVPELMGTTRAFMSTVSRKDLVVAVPAHKGGEAVVVQREVSEHAAEYIKELDKRSNNLPDDPHIDNPLKISHEGRMLSIDPRLIGLPADEDGGKIGQVVEQIMRVYEESANFEYVDALGQVEPIKGAVQLVFLDRGVPGSEGINLYEDMRVRLDAAGLSAEKVAFIHEASSDAERSELFEKCRDGRINVLIGSTEKMGTGVNVQKRAIAIHHVDVPWRPADIEQRNGRVFRQGNQNESVYEFRFVTVGSFDQLMWQTQSRKAMFQEQIMSGDSTSRYVEQDQEGAAFKAAAIAAIASGNPLVIERADVMQELTQLEALEAAFRQATLRYQAELVQIDTSITRTRGSIEELEAVRELVTKAPFEDLNGTPTDTFKEGDRVVQEAILSRWREVKEGQVSTEVGRLHGLTLMLEGSRHQWRVFSKEAPILQVVIHSPSIDDIRATGFVTKLHYAATHIDESIVRRENEITMRMNRRESIEQVVDTQTFEQGEKLTMLRSRLSDIDKQLGVDADNEEVVVEEEYVWAKDLEVLSPTYCKGVANHNLRIGDKVAHPNGWNYLVVESPDPLDRDTKWLMLDGGGEPIRDMRPVYLVGRLRSALTEWETAQIGRSKYDYVGRPHEVPLGKVFMFEHKGQCAIVRRRSVPGDERGMYEAISLPDGVEITQQYGIRPAPHTVLVKDFYTDEDLAFKERMSRLPRAEDLIIGEFIVAAVTEDNEEISGGEPFEVASQRLDREKLPDQNWHWKSTRFITSEPIYMDGWRPTEVEFVDLRPGDVTSRLQVDRQSQSKEKVTVVHVMPYSSGKQVKYRTEDGRTHLGNNRPTAPVMVSARAMAALTLGERMELEVIPPGLLHSEVASDLEEGDRFVRDEIGTPAIEEITHWEYGRIGDSELRKSFGRTREVSSGTSGIIGDDTPVYRIDTSVRSLEDVSQVLAARVRHASGDAQAPRQVHNVQLPSVAPIIEARGHGPSM